MNFKENITLIKGFQLREDGHLACKNYDFGHIDEIEGKTFTLDCNDDDLKLCETVSCLRRDRKSRVVLSCP
jgi:hypothetical protein